VSCCTYFEDYLHALGFWIATIIGSMKRKAGYFIESGIKRHLGITIACHHIGMIMPSHRDYGLLMFDARRDLLGNRKKGIPLEIEIKILL